MYKFLQSQIKFFKATFQASVYTHLTCYHEVSEGIIFEYIWLRLYYYAKLDFFSMRNYQRCIVTFSPTHSPHSPHSPNSPNSTHSPTDTVSVLCWYCVDMLKIRYLPIFASFWYIFSMKFQWFKNQRRFEAFSVT